MAKRFGSQRPKEEEGLEDEGVSRFWGPIDWVPGRGVRPVGNLGVRIRPAPTSDEAFGGNKQGDWDD